MNARAREPDYRYNLTIASIFQDEARFLKEWIEFHRMAGVQHFVLVNDRSRDDFSRVLRPYQERGEVELIDRPCPPRSRDRWVSYQRTVLQGLCKGLRGVSRWVALIDLDEFLVPAEGETLPGLLAEHEAYGGLYVRWEPFGTGYVSQLGDNELLTERLMLKWQFIRGHDMLGKSIVQPLRVRRVGIHVSELLPGSAYFDSNPGMASATARIRVHHYWSRDERFLLDVKLPRTARIKGWQLDAERIAFFKTLFNDVPDAAMQRFAPELRRRVFGAVAPVRPRASGGQPRTARGRTPASPRR